MHWPQYANNYLACTSPPQKAVSLGAGSRSLSYRPSFRIRHPAIEESKCDSEQCQGEENVNASTKDIGVLPLGWCEWQICLVNYSLIIHLLYLIDVLANKNTQEKPGTAYR